MNPTATFIGVLLNDDAAAAAGTSSGSLLLHIGSTLAGVMSSSEGHLTVGEVVDKVRKIVTATYPGWWQLNPIHRGREDSVDLDRPVSVRAPGEALYLLISIYPAEGSTRKH